MIARALQEFIMGARNPQAVARFLTSHAFPLVEGDAITFVWSGHADEVRLRHWVFGLESAQPLHRIEHTPLWFITMPLPPGSRVEYKFEIQREGRTEWVRDALNPHFARDPFGANSVAHGAGYQVPDWIHHDAGCPLGIWHEHRVESRHFGSRPVRVYLPARYRATRRYPLLVVHDGDDYVRYASLAPILDNLMARREIPDMIVALTSSPDRLREYANDERHASFVVDEMIPLLEHLWPVRSGPQNRCLMGASFGAVASLSTAVRYPGHFGRLLLQSGSFAFTDIGDRNARGPAFDPVVRFMNGWRSRPEAISERVFVSCGAYESLIYENRSLVPLLESTGMEVRFREARDGHNWENWRDRLREGLSWLFPGSFLMNYE